LVNVLREEKIWKIAYAIALKTIVQ